MFTFPLGAGRSLRLLEETDADALYAVVEANRAYLARWLPWASAQPLETTRSFLHLTRRQLADNDGFQCAIVVRGRIAGVVGFHRVDWANRLSTLGYWLAEDEQ